MVQRAPLRVVPNRIPPHNLDAEQSVLGAMLESREAIANVIEIVDSDDFYKPAHGQIYEIVVELYGRGEPADAITVADELARRGVLDAIGGKPYILGLLEAYPTASSAGRYARIVEEHALLRKLIEAGTEVQELGFSMPEEVGEAIDEAERIIYEVGERRLRDDLQPIKPLLAQSMETIERLCEQDDNVTGVASGFPDLDDITLGFQPSTLVIVAARPSMGKTSLLGDFALNAAVRHNKTSVIFSLEMSRHEVVQRFLSSEAKVDSQRLRKGSLQENDWTRLSSALGRLAEAPILIDDSANITLMEMRAKCRRLKARQGLGLVIIDYLQLMQSPRRSENRQQEVSEISRSLKLLAKELEVPVLCASQLNRGVEARADKRPLLGDLRESGCLTADTRIARADTGEHVSMGELYARGERNVPVWTIDDDLKVVRGTMTHVFSSGVKEVFRLRLRSGREVKASANHPFLSFDGWKPLEKLEIGERLAVPRSLPQHEQAARWSNSQVILLAHLIGDGCFVPRQPLHYTNSDPANLRVVAGAAGARDQSALGALEHVGEVVTNPNLDTIPVRVWQLVKESMRAKEMTSRQFAAAMGTAYCGSTLYKHSPGRRRLNQVADVLRDDRIRSLANSDVYWDEIREISSLGPEEVFDATVPGTNNFVANGIAAHNSIEQDSDMVMFIYRDEVYNPDSDARGEAELIVAKHRNGPTGTVRLAFMNQYTKFASIARHL